MVEEYINQRTFSVISYEDYNQQLQHISNCWLFYHENNYIYYALINLNNSMDCTIKYLAYQSNDEVENKQSLSFDKSNTNIVTSNNYFCVSNNSIKQTFIQRWGKYLDMEVIKIDFSNYYYNEKPNQYGQFELRNRLNSLNDKYCSNSLLVDFDFTKDNNSLYKNYISGFNTNNNEITFNSFSTDDIDTYCIDYGASLKYDYKMHNNSGISNSGFITKEEFDNPISGFDGSMHVYAYENENNKLVIKTSSILSRFYLNDENKYQMQTQSFVLNWENKNNFIKDFLNSSYKKSKTLIENRFDYNFVNIQPSNKYPFNLLKILPIVLISMVAVIFAVLFLLVSKKVIKSEW